MQNRVSTEAAAIAAATLIALYQIKELSGWEFILYLPSGSVPNCATIRCRTPEGTLEYHQVFNLDERELMLNRDQPDKLADWIAATTLGAYREARGIPQHPAPIGPQTIIAGK